MEQETSQRRSNPVPSIYRGPLRKPFQPNTILIILHHDTISIVLDHTSECLRKVLTTFRIQHILWPTKRLIYICSVSMKMTSNLLTIFCVSFVIAHLGTQRESID